MIVRMAPVMTTRPVAIPTQVSLVLPGPVRGKADMRRCRMAKTTATMSSSSVTRTIITASRRADNLISPWDDHVEP